MPNCPNCGRDTQRTEDWACQWCGHPLLSGSYRVIPKTYAQIKEERLYRSKIEAGLIPEPQPETEVEPKQDLEVIKGLKLEPELETEKEADTTREIKKGAQPKPEVEVEPEEEVKPEDEVIKQPEAEEVQEYEPETEPETELTQEPEPEPELEPAEMELTVEDMLSAYETDDVAADERFINKILRLTGVVSAIDVKDVLDINSIRLTGIAGDPLQSVQCMFGKKHSSALTQLEKGQTVTVQGRYSGSLIAMRMVDCALVH